MIETQNNGPKSDEFINKEHANLKNFPGVIREFRFGTASPATVEMINDSLDFLTSDQKPDLSKRPDHNLRVATLVKDLQPGHSNNEAYFYLPGSVGTPAGAAPIVAEVMKSMPEVATGVTFSSYASADTWGNLKDSYVTHPFERASQIAGIITETLKQHPAESIKLEGTSMGGMDMFLAALVLQGMIDKGHLDTKIAGFIFNQAGGMYDQNKLQFLNERKNEHVSAKREVEYLYPSVENFADTETALEKAKDQGDAPKAMRLIEQLENMRHRTKTPPHLSASQKAELQQMDDEIGGSYFGGNNKELGGLLKKREKYLKEIIDPMHGQGVVTGAETRILPDGGIPVLNWVKNLAPSILKPKFGIGLASQMPRALREQVKFPIAIVSGETDAYFKHDELQNAIADEKARLISTNSEAPAEEAEKLAGYFPNSPHLFIAHIANWPHNGVLVNTEKNAEIKKDIFERMDNPPQASHSTALHYVA